MSWKKKFEKISRQKPPDRLDMIKEAITDGGRPAKSVIRAFHSLMRQDAQEETWSEKEFRQSKDRKQE